jgi:hypothetical protein
VGTGVPLILDAWVAALFKKIRHGEHHAMSRMKVSMKRHYRL